MSNWVWLLLAVLFAAVTAVGLVRELRARDAPMWAAAVACVYPVLIAVAILLISAGVLPFLTLVALALAAGSVWVFPDGVLDRLGKRFPASMGKRDIEIERRVEQRPHRVGGAASSQADRVALATDQTLRTFASPDEIRAGRFGNIVTISPHRDIPDRPGAGPLAAGLGVPPPGLLGVASDAVCVGGTPLFTIPDGWVALDPRRPAVSGLVSPLLLPVHPPHDAQLLLLELERSSATGGAQILLSAMAPEGARLLIEGMDAIAEESPGTYVVSRGSFHFGAHGAEGLVIHYPESRSRGEVVDGAMVGVWAGAIRGSWYAVTAVVPAYTEADDTLLDAMFGTPDPPSRR